jgi:hypothetical protein
MPESVGEEILFFWATAGKIVPARMSVVNSKAFINLFPNAKLRSA